MENRQIKTHRLILRRPTADDFASVANLFSDVEFTKFIGGPRDKKMIQSVFQALTHHWIENSWGTWAVTLKDSGVCVGFCGFKWIEIESQKYIDLGYMIIPKYQNQGLAKEAIQGTLRDGFQHHKFQRVIACTFPENLKGVHLLKVSGFKFMRELNLEYHGRSFPSTHVYELHASEFLS